MTVQVYGANTKTLPSSISDSAWTILAGSHLIKEGKASIKLSQISKSFRYVLLLDRQGPVTGGHRRSAGGPRRQRTGPLRS